ncbi:MULTISPECIES: type I restriction endonuclease subunit R [unclassified Bradyrhizobium]|uniref:type I restriction endonuclease subunit R n=1 Tax=unclassified Bradyrhizobium TaxID=2631580 RepID=UPI001BA5E162|nr:MULTISPECIES: type I restriction endonuclease subunit R [unclassified Bradyrhizobium]MBR1208929.1 type I restriction endonuclease subunit R [Bradyrhizobium sp. AUGA SZCCT0124]MBR1317183.1 type I restriction endonuclease subunit R [Bradyrhizobium sp. AUGA SZCCT0051]MBR1345436.1 type I restriction endonuclease subunit R [Bradyrhizobium sp. AUGA SZCCT0105]MBR1360341.1 type I restriction endonuclease subunit R [Bradyrhizobium sp. AUGA SZCCT0045]
MALTPINSEDQLVQATFAGHLKDKLNWDSVYAFNDETFGPDGTLRRKDTTEAVLTRDLRAALECLNLDLPASAIDEAMRALTVHDFSRSMVQHNQDFHRLIRNGVPVSYRDAAGHLRNARARVIDFDNKPGSNRFLAVRELKLTGLRTPNYNRRADLVCFVNGLPLVFIELKAVYKNIRAGFDGNLSDYMDENVIAHAFHHNAFLIVSNGDRARYGSITSEWEHFYEWKRLEEADKGKVDAEALLDGMLAHDRLLDIIENYVLFDESKPGATRKVVARNHQVLGVNLAVSSVERQEALKREFPLEKRLRHRVIELPLEKRPTKDRRRLPASVGMEEAAQSPFIPEGPVSIVERAHPDLGRLGVFWHTQGSGKSYSMAFFAEKVRRKVEGNFTFLLMTDRHDLDDQIYKTFAGSGITGKETPRAVTGDDLERLLKENHPYIFSLIHKFNRDVDPKHPYSERDDIIVISDEAHRTQSGRLARNMRIALPNAAFIGFTGTPLFKQDEITKRIFGDYVSRYDFKRSEEDGATVKLVYENRGEKLGVARQDLNSRIAQKIEEAELDPDQAALLDKLLGKDYEIITADERLDKIAMDFVEHCATRWESGKSLLVCIDKITCARMHQRIIPLWETKAAQVRRAGDAKQAEAAAAADEVARAALLEEAAKLKRQSDWINETVIEIIISEAQNEVADFKKWDFDIIPHRALIKQGFETNDGRRVDAETAFKTPEHPFRVAIVCAMWLTGFDVEPLSTLYIDKPMKAHTLMQAIARANRVYPGKDFGLIVDYNGMLASLRAALAQYALGEDGAGGGDILAPIEERVQALIEAIEATEAHLRNLGFDPGSLIGATGFARIGGFADAVNAVYASDEAKRRFEILARQVFIRFKALLMEPTAFAYAERHDNIEAIYKKLTERRDTADVTDLLKELHRIINEAIRTQAPGEDQAEGLTFDLSQINLEKLREEFAKKVSRKATAIQDIRDIVEQKLAQMLARNPTRMDYQRRYEDIVADYNREKDRTAIEETFRRLVELVNSLDEEQMRATREGLREDELALFDLLQKDGLDRTSRERVKQASRELLASIKARLAELDRFWEKEQTKADVEVFILDQIYASLPTPPFTAEEKKLVANNVYSYVWQQAARGTFGAL